MEEAATTCRNAAVDVLLVDDQPSRASSLRMLATRAFGDLRIRSVGTLSAGLHEAQEAEKLDLVVLELGVGGSPGIEALLRFRRELPSLRVLVFSSEGDSGLTQAALEAGAVGYVPSSVSLVATVAAIRLISEAGVYVPSPESLPATPTAACEVPALTPREIEVLRLVARGFDDKDIARELDVAEDIVELQMLGIQVALGASSRVEALIIAARGGLRLD